MNNLLSIIEQVGYDVNARFMGLTDEKAVEQIKDLFLEVINGSKVTMNKGGSGEFTILDESLLRQKVQDL